MRFQRQPSFGASEEEEETTMELKNKLPLPQKRPNFVFNE
jgi:hypothetical protein